MREIPYLIQRLMKNDSPNPDAKGVDAAFWFDYMGSSEFEWGAIPKALKRLRATPASAVIEAWLKHTHSRTREQDVAHYVGPKSGLESARRVFESEMEAPDGERLSFKERTCILEAYADARRKAEGLVDDMYRGVGRNTAGWWAIDEGFGWAIFRNEADAKTWKKLVWGKATGG